MEVNLLPWKVLLHGNKLTSMDISMEGDSTNLHRNLNQLQWKLPTLMEVARHTLP